MTTAIENTKKSIQNGSLTGIEPIEKLLKKDEIKSRFSEVLGQKAAAFMSSVLAATNINTQLKACDPMTVLSSAMVAATLDLPINQSLGFAHLVPYSGRCQFQIGWKGLVQLAHRTGSYKTITVAEIYDGELVEYNRITEEIEFNTNNKKSDKVIGYYARFVLINGFEKSLYMTRAEVEAHGKKYSKSYSSGQWTKDFDSMARKTLIKLLLGKWGPMSTELRRAIVADQSVSSTITVEPENATLDYPDGNTDEEKPQEGSQSVKKTALDIKIHEAKEKVGKDRYYAILGDMGHEHMTTLSNLEKEVFLGKLKDAIKERQAA